MKVANFINNHAKVIRISLLAMLTVGLILSLIKGRTNDFEILGIIGFILSVVSVTSWLFCMIIVTAYIKSDKVR